MNKIFLPRHRPSSRQSLSFNGSPEDSDSFFSEEFSFSRQPIPIQKNKQEREEDSGEWLQKEFEGQLSVDVYQREDAIIVKSTIAGVLPEDLDIFIENEMLTIRGRRQHLEKVDFKEYLFQECYWGGFSRSIILPEEIAVDSIEANLENGILTVILPKARRSKKIQIRYSE